MATTKASSKKKATAKKKAPAKKKSAPKLAKKTRSSKKTTNTNKSSKHVTKLSDHDRKKMVAEAAYYIAQQRGFADGHAMDDWLAAEDKVNKLI